MQNIIVAGATGGIGKQLVKYLFENGYQSIPLVRNIYKSKQIFPFLQNHIEWNDTNSILSALYSSDVVFNLSGTSIGTKRWSKSYRKEIYESRVLTTRKIVSLMNQASKPLVLFNASAIGIYPSLKDEYITEETLPGDNFLAMVCRDWETEVTFLNPRHRFIIGRFGIVLKEDDLALKKILLTYKFGFGIVFDRGENWVSWIYIKDLLRSITFAIENNLEGQINFVSPNPIQYYEFIKSIGTILKKPLVINLPSSLLKLAFGEMASVLLSSQRVIPQKLNSAGYTFEYPKIENALIEIIQ